MIWGPPVPGLRVTISGSRGGNRSGALVGKEMRKPASSPSIPLLPKTGRGGEGMLALKRRNCFEPFGGSLILLSINAGSG